MSVNHQFFMFRICVDLLIVTNFKNAWLNLSIFSESCHFFYILPQLFFLEIRIMVQKKILKTIDIQNSTLACIIKSM